MPVFLVLGPMEIRTRSHASRLKGTMLQTLLATFLSAGNRLVTVETLTEELWGATPPAKADNALQAQISRLRRSLSRLEPDRKESRLATAPCGYQFSVEWNELDAAVLLHAMDVIDGRSRQDLARDIVDLRNALALWRGPVFGGLAGGPMCQAAAAKFRESRAAALELLYDLELRMGRQHKIIPELAELLAQDPLRERLCSLLMVALYRTGRQTDALNVYRRLRYRLGEDLGVDPSPEISRYEEAILNHDPLLMTAERHLAVGIGRTQIARAPFIRDPAGRLH